jgi:hypothetical protein
MERYLLGISFHYPEDYVKYEKGISEDFEGSTGIFVKASNEKEALDWAKEIGSTLFKRLNPGESKTWESFGHYAWIEKDLESSGWRHCYFVNRKKDL